MGVNGTGIRVEDGHRFTAPEAVDLPECVDVRLFLTEYARISKDARVKKSVSDWGEFDGSVEISERFDTHREHAALAVHAEHRCKTSIFIAAEQNGMSRMDVVGVRRFDVGGTTLNMADVDGFLARKVSGGGVVI